MLSMAEGTCPYSSPELKNPSLCNECGSNPWKYRCPGCSIRSCSLPCVNSHKKRTSCTGKRNCTEVVPLSQFDDKLLLSDYKLLEETKRVADSARRKSSGFPRYPCFKLPTKLLMLRSAARRRRIEIFFCPDGMSKRQKNKSRYNKWKQTIFWTIELRFHGTNVSIFHDGVDENGSLLSIFGKRLAPGPWKHKLRPFCDQLNDLKLFIRKNQKDPNSLYRKLDIKAPISSQFEDILILDYPVIFIYLPSQNYDFEVETVRMPPPSTCDGTLYKVEEVEEDDKSSDIRITHSRKSEDAETLSTTKQISEKSNGGFIHQLCTPNHAELTPISCESMDTGFYFEQEVRDAYADLIGEMNPDDFLCLDGVCDDGDDLGEGSWYEMVERENIEGSDLGESKGNEYFNENIISKLEVIEGNVLGNRKGDSEEKSKNFFFSNDTFGEMELEEGEIPSFLC